jgi:hypothetical protein
MPLAAHRFAEPQPDVALVAPRRDYYAAAVPGPEDILLLVEVADSSLRYDREQKLPAYAAAGIREVWLVDLNGESIEARRAFRRFRATCFWSYRPDLVIGTADVPWVAEQLRHHGDGAAWRVAERLCPLAAISSKSP